MSLQYRWLILTITLFILGGCNLIASSQTADQPPTPVRVQLSWLHTIEFAGLYAAEAEGYYADENLNVELRSGGFDDDGNSIDSINKVVSGEADFGLTDGGLLLTARADGVPIVAIASVYQRSPIALVSLAESNINSPEDLVGATVHVDPYTSGIIYEALLAAQKIDASEVNTIPRTDFTTAPLFNGEADVIDGWVTNELVSLLLDNHDINAILPSDYGIDIYPDVIFTTEDMITNNPELVERFLRATIRGTQSAIENPEDAAALAVTYDETLNLEHEKAAMYQSLPLLNPAGGRPGMMTAETWQKAHNFLRDQGILKGAVDVDAAYTLNFIEKIYSDEAN